MIRTTVIGSWPLPEMYLERLLQYHRGTLPEMLVKPTLAGAAEIAIREQKATAVTQFMGGEFFAEKENLSADLGVAACDRCRMCRLGISDFLEGCLP